MPSHELILQIRNLSKSFSGIPALENVQLNVQAGEVHALMGENGAGKSTLMRILIGLLQPDSGQILFEGEDLTTGNVHDALEKGISMIHQEMLPVPELTVAQNIFLGRETNGGLFSWLNDRSLTEKARVLLAQLGLTIPPDARMKNLSVAQMQLVEIAKAVSNKAKVIIMDEPTSALANAEVEALFTIVRELTRQGVAIIYISHKMDEIFALADTITVLRDGKYITTKPAAELDENRLISLMVGRELDRLFPETTTETGPEVLSVKNLSGTGAFSDINVTVHAGEVLGFAGLMGAGRTEIARVLYGLDTLNSGEIRLNGLPVSITSPHEAIRQGIGYVSEDRKEVGLVPGMSVRDNITLSSLPYYAQGQWIQGRREAEAAEKTRGDLNIKTANLTQQVRYLSGGNQQKVVIGKVLLTSPKLLILDEPTRGIDVGAKAEIYKLITRLKAQGMAIILISSELPELLGLSDRILVLANGKQTAVLDKKEATQEMIMRYAV